MVNTMNVSITSFHEAEQAIRHVRGSVFVKEQGVPNEDEYDDNDNVCVHAIAWDDGRPVGTGRLSDDGRIGRIAVMRQARGKGTAKAIILALEQHARKCGLSHLWAHAQVQALGFYKKVGYLVEGDAFMEDGIPHKRIKKSIQPADIDDIE
jgi:predicted GNAT family N-acyltransferase